VTVSWWKGTVLLVVAVVDVDYNTCLWPSARVASKQSGLVRTRFNRCSSFKLKSMSRQDSKCSPASCYHSSPTSSTTSVSLFLSLSLVLINSYLFSSLSCISMLITIRYDTRV